MERLVGAALRVDVRELRERAGCRIGVEALQRLDVGRVAA